jgi:hypothetical protein
MQRACTARREDIKLDITDWREEEEALQTRWRFSAILSLPWRPRLAAAGGTTHVFSKVCASRVSCCQPCAVLLLSHC